MLVIIQLYTVIRMHHNAHIKLTNIIVYKLYFKKDDFKNWIVSNSSFGLKNNCDTSHGNKKIKIYVI